VTPSVAFLVQDIDATGGAERQASLLAGRLARRGLRIEVASVVHPARLRAAPGHLRPAGVPIARLPWLGLDASLPVWLRSRGPWDALYAVGATLGAVAARVAPVVGASVVCKLACAGPPGDLAEVASWPPAVRDAALAGLASGRVVTITDELAAEARAAGLPEACLVSIRNGVDAGAIAGATPVSSPGGPVVLAVGRLDPQKGFDVLLAAWPEVRAAHPTARLHLVGQGPARDALEAQARGLAGVELLGRRDDVPGRLRGATVVALPSRAEGLSNVLLEALAAGAPVVASRIPSVVEVTGDGPDAAALLVPPDAPSTLAAALVRALADGELRGRLAAAGQARVAAAFGIEAVADAYADLFRALPRGTPPGRLGFVARFAAARAGDLRRRSRKRRLGPQ
jgi:glycosyltransferase involved in cell wall biosynthesis